MDTVLLNPNIAYLFLAGGVLLTFFALVTPGTGFLEVGAFFLLALAGHFSFGRAVRFGEGCAVPVSAFRRGALAA